MTDRNELVSALRGIVGVAEAEIVDDASGVGTLRLALVPGADEVAVAIEVNRVLRDGFGMGVDNDRVQVVEETWPASPAGVAEPVAVASAAPEPEEPVRSDPDVLVPSAVAAEPGVPIDVPPVAASPPVVSTRVAQAGLTGGRRLAIRRLQLVSSGTGISTAVSLGLGPDTYVGEADAESAVEAVQRAVAVATVRAVESVAGSGLHLDIERVEVAPLGADWVALVVVLFTDGDRTDRLTGASVVREDVRQAVIRASLDAVNRRVEDILRRRTI